jgi:hypothetical protein
VHLNAIHFFRPFECPLSFPIACAPDRFVGNCARLFCITIKHLHMYHEEQELVVCDEISACKMLQTTSVLRDVYADLFGSHFILFLGSHASRLFHENLNGTCPAKFKATTYALKLNGSATLTLISKC